MAFDDFNDLIAGAANPYGTPARGEWNLTEGSFTNAQGVKCIFYFEKPVGHGLLGNITSLFSSPSLNNEDRSQRTALDQVSDGGGRRVAIYEYPYLAGQRTKDLGRRGEKFTFNIKFHGSNYQTKFQEFLQVVVQSSGSGLLSHPVRGKVQAQFLDYEFVHRYDESNAVTIRANWAEDNTGQIAAENLKPASPNSALRTALQGLTAIQATIQQSLFAAGAALLLPQAIVNAMNLRLQSITDQTSLLLGQLAVTFSSDGKLKALATDAASVSGGVSALSSGTVAANSNQPAQVLPPVYQVGFSPADQTAILQRQSLFVSANQITTQQAVFSANQARSAIVEAIAEIDFYTSNTGYDATLQYRELAVLIQQATESCVASAQALVTIYTVPYAMSLRTVAFLNGLTVDRQNDIEALNPYVGSINYIPEGVLLTVPAA